MRAYTSFFMILNRPHMIQGTTAYIVSNMERFVNRTQHIVYITIRCHSTRFRNMSNKV